MSSSSSALQQRFSGRSRPSIDQIPPLEHSNSTSINVKQEQRPEAPLRFGVSTDEDGEEESAAPFVPYVDTSGVDLVEYNSPPMHAVLRFAYALASALNEKMEHIYSHYRMWYILNSPDECDKDIDLLNETLIDSFELAYQYLFVDVHYVIERTFQLIKGELRIHCTLYQLIADELSLSRFVTICGGFYFRVKCLHSGTKKPNNTALRVHDAQIQESLCYYRCLTRLTPTNDPTIPSKTFDFTQPGVEAMLITYLELKCIKRKTRSWLFHTLVHRAMNHKLTVMRSGRNNSIPTDFRERMDDPSQWYKWMPAKVYNAIQMSWNKMNAAVPLSVGVLDMMNCKDDSVLFATLVGVTHYLHEGSTQLYKRDPVMHLLERTQYDLIQLLI